MTPTLDLRKPAHLRWREVLKAQAPLWHLAEEQVSADLTLKRKIAATARSVVYPSSLKVELASAASWIPGISGSFLKAAQVMYDELWSLCGDTPICGCTSVSTPAEFGRNLDWGYPDRVKELVTEFEVIDTRGNSYLVEGFAGLFGWLAVSGETRSMSLNQAPSTRPVGRASTPALWWFRELLEAPLPRSQDGVTEYKITNAPGADMLLHVKEGKRRFIAETLGDRIRLLDVSGEAKRVQTNEYTLFPHLSPPAWRADSDGRVAAAMAGANVTEGLDNAWVNGWSVHRFMMR